MSRVRYLTLGFTLVALLTHSWTAAADPISITSGEITISGAQDFLSRGFLRSIFFDFATETFRVSGGEGDGVVQRVLTPSLTTPVTLIRSGGVPEMAGLVSALTITATPASTPTPFELMGTLSFFAFSTGAPLLSEAVSGRGTANWQFVATPAGTLTVSGVAYQFSDDVAVPEPATLLLVGAGLAGVAARRGARAGRSRSKRTC